MKNIMKKLNNKKLIIIIFFAIVITSVILLSRSYAAPISESVEIDEGSNLVFNISVDYTGKDQDGTTSTNIQTSLVKSGIIDVSDTIPYGFNFDGFVTNSTGVISATKKSDNQPCSGRVLDDTNEESPDTGQWNSGNTEYTYHGLHYTKNNRTVTFKVTELQAGCQIVVGIKVKASETLDDPNTSAVENRRDFYNEAYGTEGSFSKWSNQVHAYMGIDKTSSYTVYYQYNGTVPENAPSLPENQIHEEKTQVSLATTPGLAGYDFIGWNTEDATIVGGKFTMPDHDVVIKGTFQPRTKKYVRYRIEGTVPDGYVVPEAALYSAGDTVTVNNLQFGTVVNGYIFQGWTCTSVDISTGQFIMPNNEVIIKGSFVQKKYNVTYTFTNENLPPGYEALLPASRSYAKGSYVNLADPPAEPSTYRFQGWVLPEGIELRENKWFTMPEEDVTITGSWRRYMGEFEPTITKEVINAKQYYKSGDYFETKITITNPSAYVIGELEVEDDGVFDEVSGYEIISSGKAKVTNLQPGQSVELFTKYTVTTDDGGTIQKTAKITSATGAEEGYELKPGTYKSTASFTVHSKLEICNVIVGTGVNDTFLYHMSNTAAGFETSLVIGENVCKVIYLPPATYKLREVVPQEYQLDDVYGAMQTNNSNITIEEGQAAKVTFQHNFIKKGFFHSFYRKEKTVHKEGGS